MIPLPPPVLLPDPAAALEALPGPTFDLTGLAARAADLTQGARTANTRWAYASHRRHFTAWCAAYGLKSLLAKPSGVGSYLATQETTLRDATLTRRLPAIAVVHRIAGHTIDLGYPTIRDAMCGLRRAKRVAQNHAQALTIPLLRRILAGCGEHLIDRRDRALPLIAFIAALRRCELVTLDHADLAVVPLGLRVRIRRSKSDHESARAAIGTHRTGSNTCPVAATDAWIAAAGLGRKVVFRGITRHGLNGVQLSPQRGRSDRAQAGRRRRTRPDAALWPLDVGGVCNLGH